MKLKLKKLKAEKGNIVVHRSRNTYSDKYKMDIVKLCKDYSLSKVSKYCDIDERILRRWKNTQKHYA